MKQTIVMAVMLMALMACKNSQTQVAEIIDLPRAETPDSVDPQCDDCEGRSGHLQPLAE